MIDETDSFEPGRRGRGRRRRSRFGKRRELTPEERVYREAERRARAKERLVRHSIAYGFTILLLIAMNVRLAFIVAFGWGIGLALNYFSSIVAPGLREKWIRQEVDQQVNRTVTRERRQREGEKARSLEELSASIAHEIRNPITAAKSLVQQMGEDPASTDNVEYASVALEELNRVERSISHLLRYAREEDMNIRSVRLAEIIDSAVSTLRDRIERMEVEIRSDLDTLGEVDGDGDKLRQVFINLFGNALDAFEEARTPRPRIDVALGESLAGTEVWVRVRDNGPGMDVDTQERIFSPFYTSKANGTGLGLAISRKLVDAHGGTIELKSDADAGSEFVLTLPKQVPTS